MNTSILMGQDIPISFSISGGIAASMSVSGGGVESDVDVNHNAEASYEITSGIRASMNPSPGNVEFEAAVGTIINAGIRKYTADEDLPDEIGGVPNPNKNILVDNNHRTIQANILTAAQLAAMLN